MKRYLLVFVLFLATLGVGRTSFAETRGSLQIGSILPLSGDLANLGSKIRDGISMAAEEAGARVKFEDGAFNKQQTLSAFRKLTSQDKIKFIIGPAGPDQTLAIAPTLEKAQALLIAISLCDSRFAQYENVFCIFPTSADQLAPLLKRLDDPKVHKIAYIGEELQGFQEHHDSIRAAVARRGQQMVLDQTYNGGFSDFRPLLARLKATGVDVLAVSGANMATVASAFAQARELGIKPQERWYLSEHDAEFFRNNRELLEGAYSLAIPRLSEAFAKRYQERYGYEPDLYSSLSYDATKALLKALSNASSPQTVSDVRRRMLTDQLEATATVDFSFNSKRMVKGMVSLTRIGNGKVEFVVTPETDSADARK